MLKLIAAATALACFATPALAQYEAQAMGVADSNHDGKVSLAEYAAYQELGWNYLTDNADSADPERTAGHLLLGIPTDANGILTRKAFLAYVPKRFKAADENADGSLDAREFIASLAGPVDE